MHNLLSNLKKYGYTLYVNTSNCGHCLKQILFFDNYLDRVDIVHCDDSRNKAVCDVNALPLWKSELGMEYEGSKLSFQDFNGMFT